MNQRGPTRRALLAAGLAGAVPARAWAARPSPRGRGPGDGPVFDVTRFGASGDGRTLVTARLQAAIDECGRRGGGTVLFPPGEYVSAPLMLRDNVGLHLTAGARLTASPNISDYPAIKGRAGGVERDIYASLVTGIGLANVSITGRGTLDGNGLIWMEAHRQLLDLRKKLGLVGRSDGMLTYPPGAPLRYPRPRVVNLIRCQAVSLSDFNVERTPAWTVHLCYCEEVDVSGIRIHGYQEGQGTSGLVLDSCKDVRVSRCRVSAGDDGISIKSGYDEDGRRVGIECSDIAIQSCTFIDSQGAGIAVGSETAGGIRNVTVANCVFDNLRWAFRIKTNRGRGGVVENIQMSQLVISRPGHAAFDITGFHDKGLPAGPPETTPLFRNIVCSDLLISGARTAGSIIGLPERWFEDITLRNISIVDARAGLSCSNVKGLTLENIAVAPAEGPAVSIREASDVEVRQLRLGPGSGPALELEGVTRALIASCRAPDQMKTFLALKGGANSGVVLMNNAIPAAAAPTGPGIVLLR